MKNCYYLWLLRKWKQKPQWDATTQQLERLFIVKKKKTVLRRMWKTKCPEHCWLECKMVHLLWKIVWQFLKKLKIELPYDPVVLLLIYTKKNWTQALKYLYSQGYSSSMSKDAQ